MRLSAVGFWAVEMVAHGQVIHAMKRSLLAIKRWEEDAGPMASIRMRRTLAEWAKGSMEFI